jgi:hypothetical protein
MVLGYGKTVLGIHMGSADKTVLGMRMGSAGISNEYRKRTQTRPTVFWTLEGQRYNCEW